MSVDWMARQLSISRPGLRLELPRYNPRPAGVMRPDGTTRLILEMLQANRGRFFTMGEVIVRVGCTKRAADWGLRFLKGMGHIECSTDEGRNSRYLRYSYTGDKR